MSALTHYSDLTAKPGRKPFPVKALIMWLFPVLFLAYQFIWRLWPGLIMDSIMERFQVGARDFGLLAALYYYGYAGMQVPVALLLDRYGARWVTSGFILLCALSALMFNYTESWFLACLSRFLIGVGSAVGLLGVMKVLTDWLNKAQYERMVGVSVTVALMGALYGGKPVSLLVARYDSQSVGLILIGIAFLLAFGVMAVVRKKPLPAGSKKGASVDTSGNPAASEKQPEEGFSGHQFRTVLKSPMLWVLGLANLLMVGPLEGFADVWGSAYLTVAYGLPQSDAAGLVSFIFLGMLVGGPLLVFVGQKWGVYKSMALCGIGMVALLGVLLAQWGSSSWLLGSLFFVIGILCCYQVLMFTAGADLMPAGAVGVTVAFLNCLNMLGGSLFHTVIGRLVDTLSRQEVALSGGAPVYSVGVYTKALSFIPFCALIGVILVAIAGLRFHRRVKYAAGGLSAHSSKAA